MLKILFYDTNFIPGLSRTIYLGKIKYWQKGGAKIGIVCTRDGESFYRQHLKNINFYTVDFRYKIRGAYSLIWEVLKVNFLALFLLPKIKGKFEIIYSASSVIDFVFLPWIIKNMERKIKWFVMVDNLVPPPQKRPGRFLRNLIPYLAFLLGNLLLKKADGIFVLATFLYDYYKNRGYKVIKTGKHYGVETKIFEGPISQNAPRFDALYVGRLHEAKGVFDLVEVVREVVKIKKDFTLGIMGDGEESVKKRLHDKIISDGLKDNIIFNGYVTGKLKGDIIRRAGFFLFLSYDEAGSHAVLEAIVNNKLVVAYNLPAYFSVYEKNIARGQMVFFKPKEFKSIADFIVNLDINKLTFSNKLKDYTWDKICQKEWEAFSA